MPRQFRDPREEYFSIDRVRLDGRLPEELREKWVQAKRLYVDRPLKQVQLGPGGVLLAFSDGGKVIIQGKVPLDLLPTERRLAELA